MEPDAYERRRYSAVLLAHPDVRKLADLSKVTRGGLSSNLTSIRAPGPWRIARSEWLAEKSHYPDHIVPAKERARPGGYAHDFYVGVRAAADLPTGAGNLILVASPYVRLLGGFLKRLGQNVRPEPRFVAVDLESAVSIFADMSADSPFKVKRVTLQVLRETQRRLELVALSGRNPLHSDLLQLINRPDRTRPFGLGVAVSDEPEVTIRVNFDRHGNFSWHLSRERQLLSVLRIVDEVLMDGLAVTTRTVPLDRADPEEQP